MLTVLSASLAVLRLFKPPAYLDPGSGSYVFQLLLAALAGAAFLLKVYWGRIKAFFNRRSPSDPKQPTFPHQDQ